MGGTIKVVKKDSPGTLMQLSLILKTPGYEIEQNERKVFTNHSLKVRKILSSEYTLLILFFW